MTSNIKVDFSLQCCLRKDAEAKILVGYIPALRLYSQGHDEEELRKALVSAAEMFIIVCYEKGIFGQVLRDRGMTKASGIHVARKTGEYIAVAVCEPRYEKTITIKVPIELLAAHEVINECLPH